MKVYRNRFYGDDAAMERQRSGGMYVVACEAEEAPVTEDRRWEESTGRLILDHLTHLYTQDGVRYWGYP